MNDLTGQIFNRWTVLNRAPNMPNRRDVMWRCLCTCGTIDIKLGFTLINNTSKSCGCLRSETNIALNTRHNSSKTKLYKVWGNAKHRCNNLNSSSYHNYGGRGIGMSKIFQDSFEAFCAELGPQPTPKHTVDRIDNDKGYEPGNLRWATRKEQAKNKRPKLFYPKPTQPQTIVYKEIEECL